MSVTPGGADPDPYADKGAEVGPITIDEALPVVDLVDEFEDNVIDPGLWIYGGSQRAWEPDVTSSGDWHHALHETLFDSDSDDGYLQMRVDGPESANTYGAEAWVRTAYNYNDGNAHVVNFTWKADALDSHFNHYFVQITDGYVAPSEFNYVHWTSSTHTYPQERSGTTDLLWSSYNDTGDEAAEEVRGEFFGAGHEKATWSIAIDPAGVARLYDGPDGSGTLLREETLSADGPWFVRLMVSDATSAGFSAGDARLNLYSFSSSSYAVNHAPTGVADAYNTSEETRLTIDPVDGVLADDSDPDGDPLSVLLVDGPAQGELTLNNDGSFEYLPGVDFAGSDSFTYRATDGELESDPIVVTITVSPVNSVAGSVFEDIDADALRDINEGGLAGWTLQIDSVGTSGELIHTLMRPTNGAPDTDTGLETSVAFLGDDILVGAVYDDTGAIDAGAVHLYDGDTGEYIRSFVNPTGNTHDRFGASVMAYGDDVLVTAPGQWGWNSGAVYQFDATLGQLLHTFFDPEPEREGEFGASMAVVGDNILIGSKYEHTSENWAGKAFLFDRATGELLQTYTSEHPAQYGKFGSSLASNGSRVLIGQNTQWTGSDQAQAYTYDADTFTVETDAEGNYRFDGVKPGTYRVRAIARDDYELSMPDGNGDYEAVVVSGYVEDNFDFGGVPIENWAARAVGDHYSLDEGTTLTLAAAGALLGHRRRQHFLGRLRRGRRAGGC